MAINSRCSCWAISMSSPRCAYAMLDEQHFIFVGHCKSNNNETETRERERGTKRRRQQKNVLVKINCKSLEHGLMYGVVHTHTHTKRSAYVYVCLCLCAMFVLPVGICSDFELLLCFARQQQQHRQHFCNRCQRRVVCFLTCFAVGCAHVLIDYMSAAQDTAGNGTKGGMWLTTAAAWTYNVLNVHMHRLFAYSSSMYCINTSC